MAVLSPVFASPSSQEKSPSNWDTFSALVKKVNIPVYALGGMALRHLELAKQHGTVGIAAIRALRELAAN